MDYLELNTKLKEAEKTIKYLKIKLKTSKVELQEWEIHNGRFPKHTQGNSSKFYIREKDSYSNVCEIYGGKEKGKRNSLIISKVPQMLSIINKLADRTNPMQATINLLSRQAIELQKLMQLRN